MNTKETPQATERGILYIAFGEKYRIECARSLASLKRHDPDLPACVITDADWCLEPTPERLLYREPKKGLHSKVAYISASPFEQTLFLDTDTVVVAPISDVFDLLRDFDFGAYFLPQFLRSEPYMLPWCNSGVMVFRTNERVLSAFKRWDDLFQGVMARGGRGRIPADRVLPLALAQSSVRVVHLASSLNFVLWEPNYTKSPLRIIHSRDELDINSAKKINANWNPAVDIEPRVWVPQLHDWFPTGGLRPPGMWVKDPLIALSVLVRRLYRLWRTRASSLRT